jgi:hypothetical protein
MFYCGCSSKTVEDLEPKSPDFLGVYAIKIFISWAGSPYYRLPEHPMAAHNRDYYHHHHQGELRNKSFHRFHTSKQRQTLSELIYLISRFSPLPLVMLMLSQAPA